MKKNKHKKKYIVLAIIILFILCGYIFLNRTVRTNSNSIEGFTPIKDDSLALRYTPKIIADNEVGEPYKVLYRAAKDDHGNTYIAYHFVWKNEINKSKGIMPMLNRNIYTGGIGLQKKMFGKEDIEVILLTLDVDNNIIEVDYETAVDYDVKDFTVKHKNVKIKKTVKSPIYFQVISWNHLYDFIEKYDKKEFDNNKVVELVPEYFSNKEWDYYKMFKEKETMISKNRAHYEFERVGIE